MPIPKKSLRAATSSLAGSACSCDGLTRDQALVAKGAVDDILAILCCCNILKAEGGEIPGEEIMHNLLSDDWEKATAAALKKALAKIKAGSGAISEAEVAGIYGVIEEQIAVEFAAPVGKELSGLVLHWYGEAKKGIVTAHDLKMAWAAVDDKATAWLAEHHMYWVHGYYEKHLSDALAAHVAEGMKEGLGRQAIGQSLQDFFTDYPGVRNRPLNYWRGFAANGMNRTRQFGMIQGWTDLGITELEVLAVMDERTSAICREMNGRIIPVGRCVDQRDQLMAAKDPEEIKSISPWPSLKQLTGKSTQAVMDQGVVAPPYHFHCRTTLVER